VTFGNRLPALVAIGAVALLALGCPSRANEAPRIGADDADSIDGASSSDASTDAASDAGDASTTADATNAGAMLDGGTCSPALAPKALSRLACLPDPDHLAQHTMGYSKDGRYFGFCISRCDACPTSCEMTGKNRPPVSFTFASYHDYAGPKTNDADVELRMKKHDEPHRRFLADNELPGVTAQRVLHGPWKYPDLVLATRSSTDDAKGTSILEVGASVDADEPVFPLRLELGSHPMWNSKPMDPPKGSPADVKQELASWRDQWRMRPASAAVVDVAPDGNELGVVAFASGSMWYEDARSTRIAIHTFAARVYDDASRAARTRGDTPRATELAARASAARTAK